MKIISYALFRSPRRAVESYAGVLVAGLGLAARHLPGWQPRVYCDGYCAGRFGALLADLGAQVHAPGGRAEGLGPMFWRLLPIADPAVTHALFRDADSLITRREAKWVAEWQISGLPALVVQDHPQHLGHPIPGGLWGCATATLRGAISERVLSAAETPPAEYGADETFLARAVAPLLQERHIYRAGDPSRERRDYAGRALLAPWD